MHCQHMSFLLDRVKRILLGTLRILFNSNVRHCRVPIFTSNGFTRVLWHLEWIFEKKEEEEEMNFIEYNCLFLLL